MKICANSTKIFREFDISASSTKNFREVDENFREFDENFRDPNMLHGEKSYLAFLWGLSQ
jgi:hypothetical protein